MFNRYSGANVHEPEAKIAGRAKGMRMALAGET
jgi:hypothetical protein